MISRTEFAEHILYYKRYVDDIIIITDNKEVMDTVFIELNRVDKNIRLTRENVDENKELAFLDTKVKITSTGVRYRWYQKNIHSGNALNNHSHFPEKGKKAVLKNRFVNIARRCDNVDAANVALNTMRSQFILNGFSTALVDEQLHLAKLKLYNCLKSCAPWFKQDKKTIWR